VSLCRPQISRGLNWDLNCIYAAGRSTPSRLSHGTTPRVYESYVYWFVSGVPTCLATSWSPHKGSHCMRYNKICRDGALGHWSIASLARNSTEIAHLEQAVCAHMHLTQFVPFVHDIYSWSTAPHTEKCTTVRFPCLKEADHSSSQYFHQ